MNMTQQLNKNLLMLAELETEFQQNYSDKYLFKQINLRKKSLGFFLDNQIYDRALYESNELVSFLIKYLTD